MRKLMLKHVYLRLPPFLRLAISLLAAMAAFGIFIHYLEPETFPTVFIGIWWTFVTASTVGYGDYVPETLSGKLAGIALILSGGGLIAYYITSISAAAVRHGNQLTEGKIAFKGADHYIFIGWNNQTKAIYSKVKEREPDRDVVVIDRTMDRFPLEKYPIHFVKGDASLDRTLEYASIRTAAAIIITADPGMPPRQADNSTILAAIAIRGNNEEIRIIAELLTNKQLANARRAGVTALIRTDHCISSLLCHELYCTGEATPFRNVIELLATQHFRHEALEREQTGSKYADLLIKWKKDGRLLIGVDRNGDYMMNPPADFLLKAGDMLIFMICSKN